MPIYAYMCTACGHEMDKIQKMSDAPLTDCPACEAPALKKKLTAAAFQLKGSGWYVTDFKDNGKKPAAKDNAAQSSSETSNKTADSKSKSESGSSAAKPAESTQSSTKKPAATSSSGG